MVNQETASSEHVSTFLFIRDFTTNRCTYKGRSRAHGRILCYRMNDLETAWMKALKYKFHAAVYTVHAENMYNVQEAFNC